MPQLDTSCCLFENGSVASGSEFAWERARASYSGGDEDFDWRYSRAPDGACATVVTDGEHVVSRVLGTRKRAVLDGELHRLKPRVCEGGAQEAKPPAKCRHSVSAIAWQSPSDIAGCEAPLLHFPS